MKILMVGGVFDKDGGRPSGYFAKLADVMLSRLKQNGDGDQVYVVNGGTFNQLANLTVTVGITHVIWFADVPNVYEKVLPLIVKRNPGVVLVQSKSNIGRRYTAEELYARMHVSGAELLVEFDRVGERISAQVLTCTGGVLIDRVEDVRLLARVLIDEFERIDRLIFPFAYGGDVPVGDHEGAFGVMRRHDVHSGVDLYGEVGQPVRAIEDGREVGIHAFTGAIAGSPWWNDTFSVMVAGESGVLLYGEIQPVNLPVDRLVKQGQIIGYLLQVLKKDKGKPMTMLHMERYVHGTRLPIKVWKRDDVQLRQLLDPTPLLKVIV